MLQVNSGINRFYSIIKLVFLKIQFKWALGDLMKSCPKCFSLNTISS